MYYLNCIFLAVMSICCIGVSIRNLRFSKVAFPNCCLQQVRHWLYICTWNNPFDILQSNSCCGFLSTADSFTLYKCIQYFELNLFKFTQHQKNMLMKWLLLILSAYYNTCNFMLHHHSLRDKTHKLQLSVKTSVCCSCDQPDRSRWLDDSCTDSEHNTGSQLPSLRQHNVLLAMV